MANLQVEEDMETLNQFLSALQQPCLQMLANVFGNFLKRRPQRDFAEQIAREFQDFPNILLGIFINLLKPDSVSYVLINNLPTIKVNGDQLAENDTCRICDEKFHLEEYVKLLTCGHYYHEECITDWCETLDECPHCKERIQDNQTNSQESLTQRDEIFDILIRVLSERHPQYLRAFSTLARIIRDDEIVNPVPDTILLNLPIIKMDCNRLSRNNECTICLTKFKVDEFVMLLPCEHFYHEVCIRSWFKNQNTCPYCRKECN